MYSILCWGLFFFFQYFLLWELGRLNKKESRQNYLKKMLAHRKKNKRVRALKLWKKKRCCRVFLFADDIWVLIRCQYSITKNIHMFVLTLETHILEHTHTLTNLIYTYTQCIHALSHTHTQNTRTHTQNHCEEGTLTERVWFLLLLQCCWFHIGRTLLT